MPPSLAPIEARLRALVQQQLARGRVEVAIDVQSRPAPPARRRRAERGVPRGAVERARARARAGLVIGGADAGRPAAVPAGAQRSRERPRSETPDAAMLRRRSKRRSPRRSTSSITMRDREGALPAGRSRRPARASSASCSIASPRPRRRPAPTALRARLRERVAELRADALASTRRLIAQEIVALRRPVGHHRGIVRFRGAPRALAGAVGRARAVRPQARLPAPGDEPRGQHARIEGGRHRRSPRSSSTLKAELEKMREQVQNVE